MANVLCENCTLVSVDGDTDAIIKICFIHSLSVVAVLWVQRGQHGDGRQQPNLMVLYSDVEIQRSPAFVERDACRCHTNISR